MILSKKKIKKEYFFFLIISMGFMFSVSGTRPIVPLFAKSLGMDNTTIGFIIATYAFIPFFLSVFLGRFIDKIGTSPPLFLSFILAIVGLTLLSFLKNMTGLLLSQTIVGTSQVFFMITMQTYASNFKEKIKMSKYITFFSIGIALGSFLGPAVNGYISDYWEYSASFLYSGVLLFFFMPIVFLLKTQKQKESIKSKTTNKLSGLIKIESLRRAFLVSSLILLGKDIYIAFFPLIANSKGFSTSLIGIIISINAGAGIMIRLFLPYILSSKYQDIIMNIILVKTGVLYVIIAFSNHLFMIISASFVLGICVGIGQPLTITKTINSLPSNRTGEGLGIRVSINRLTQTFYPIILGTLATTIGFVGVFTTSGVIITLATINYKKVFIRFKSFKVK